MPALAAIMTNNKILPNNIISDGGYLCEGFSGTRV